MKTNSLLVIIRPKGLEVEHSLSDITRVLMLDDEDDAADFVSHCGFEIIDSQVSYLSLSLSLSPSLPPSLPPLDAARACDHSQWAGCRKQSACE